MPAYTQEQLSSIKYVYVQVNGFGATRYLVNENGDCYPLFECQKCFAIVSNRDEHTKWHLEHLSVK